jgi:hypothetical protein
VVGEFLLTSTSHCCDVSDFRLCSFTNILQPQKFDPTPYISQGHLLLRPFGRKLLRNDLLISWFELEEIGG